MDRKIEKKSWSRGRLVLIIGGSAGVLVLAWLVLSQSGKTRLSIDPGRITVSRVESGEFQEYYPSSGWVEPEISYYLDVEQGGRVAEILAEGGQFVQKGDLILKLSNASLERQNIETEMRLMEILDMQQNTQFARTTNTMVLRESLQDLEYQILDLEKRYKRYKALMEKGTNNLALEQFEAVRDELDYRKKHRELLLERIRVEDKLSDQQLERTNQSIERVNISLELLKQIAASMDVRAPITGHLSSISAEVGQNISPGQRIGQIDILEKFKVRVEVDQYYLNRVEVGTRGKFELNGKTYALAVKKIYPEVQNNIFNVDMTFIDQPPANLKRGQELTVELSFGEPSRSLMVSKGGFYQQTSGRWVYLISEDGQSAQRTDIRLGRQNPRYVEVLDGLREGDWVITSGYDSFNAVDQLLFSKALDLGR